MAQCGFPDLLIYLSSLYISLSDNTLNVYVFTSVSGSLFLHTLSAAELRLVVDVKLDRWKEKKRAIKTDGEREVLYFYNK